MRFNTDMTLRGKPLISWIERDKRSNKVRVELDRFCNKSVLSFDPIGFQSFVATLDEYLRTGGLPYEPSATCQSQFDLDRFSLDLSEDQRFSVKFDLGDLTGSCDLIIKSNHTQISFHFKGDQIIRIMEKFKNALDGKQAVVEAEKETIIRSWVSRP